MPTNITLDDIKIPDEVWNEAKKIAGGLYRMNAPCAIGYGFNFNAKTKEISSGMFIDRKDELKDFEGWIKF